MFLTAAFFVSNVSGDCISIDDGSQQRPNVESILHINMQGLAGKTLILESFLESVEHRFLAICICEHWLSDAEIDGLVIGKYRVVASFSRVLRKRGGVAIMLRDDYCCDPFSLRGFCVELVGELAGVVVPALNLTILTVYRSPSENFEDFLIILTDVFDYLNVSCQSTIITGDFNVFFNERDVRKTKLTDIMTEYGLFTDFFEPTRLHHCLDNIFSNINLRCHMRTMDIVCSDHLGVAAEFHITKGKVKNDYNLVRPVTQKGLNSFYHYVDGLNFGFAGDAGLALSDRADRFMQLLADGAELCFPRRRLRCDQQANLQIKWFTEDLRQMRSTLAFLSDACHGAANPQNLIMRNEYRKLYRESLNSARLSANSKFIREHSRSARSIWKVINSNRSVNTATRTTISADTFNSFFLNVPKAIMTKIKGTNDPIDLLEESLPFFRENRSFFEFSRVSELEVRNVFDRLKNKKSNDFYGLNTVMIKKVKNLVIPPLTKLINGSIEGNCFPDCLKVACVVPIFKRGDSDDPNNYRPISILPIVSKIYESILKEQLVKYLEERQLLTGAQFGFRAGRSTVGAAACLIDDIVDGFEAGDYSCASFLDLSKAFDCVNHSVLLRKLHMYGLCPSACRLLASYLGNRRQTVSVDGQESRPGIVNVGVPQGSILGPILFLVFINDLPGVIGNNNTSIVLYADDTTVLTQNHNLQEAQASHVEVVGRIENWFAANGLLLNNEKTVDLTFTLNRLDVAQSSAKFLGFLLDSKLAWTDHGECLTKRLSSIVFLLRRLSPTVTHQVLITAYFGLFQGQMSYGILLWGHSAALQRVFSIQRRAVRILCGLGYRDDCRGFFAGLGIMTVPSLFIFECLKYIKSDSATRLTHGDVHSYNTRNRDDIKISFKRLTKSRNGVNHYAAQFYNVIHRSVRVLPSRSFLSIMKKYLLKKAYYSLEEFLKDDHLLLMED